MKTSYLLVRVENFSRFGGENLAADPVMKHGQRGGVPHEIHNFTVASDGFIYGYLPTGGISKLSGGDLTKLGGNKGDAKVSKVTVIFISSGVLCGFYRNATAFSYPFRHPDKLKADGSPISCSVRVRPENAFLISAGHRNDERQPKPSGQSQVLYGGKNPDWVDWFENLAPGVQKSYGSEKKRRKWARTVERSSRARTMALKEYGHQCECCKITHNDNVRASVFEVHHKVPYAEELQDA